MKTITALAILLSMFGCAYESTKQPAITNDSVPSFDSTMIVVDSAKVDTAIITNTVK